MAQNLPLVKPTTPVGLAAPQTPSNPFAGPGTNWRRASDLRASQPYVPVNDQEAGGQGWGNLPNMDLNTPDAVMRGLGYTGEMWTQTPIDLGQEAGYQTTSVQSDELKNWLNQNGYEMGWDEGQNLSALLDRNGVPVVGTEFTGMDSDKQFRNAGLIAAAIVGGGIAGAGAGGGAGAGSEVAALDASQVGALQGGGGMSSGLGSTASGLAPIEGATSGLSVAGAGEGAATVSTLGESGALSSGLQGALGGGSLQTGGEAFGSMLQQAGSNLVDKAVANPLQTATTAYTLNQLAKGGGDVPTFDAPAASKAQGDANKDTALFNTLLNRPDQVTPYGSSSWTLKPGADPKNPQPGDWTQTVSLSPAQQQLLDSDQALQLGLSGAGQAALGRTNAALGQPLDTSGLPAMGQVSNFTEDSRQRIEDALMARLAPQFAHDEEAMRSRTLNTGFELGSEGSLREQLRLDQAKNDARLAAIAQSGQEAERLGNISRADATFQNQAHQQALQELLAQRALPLNELNAIRSGTQVQLPQFQPVSQTNVASTPVLEALMAQLTGQQANAANKQSGYNALLASLAQLGGSYLNGD